METWEAMIVEFIIGTLLLIAQTRLQPGQISGTGGQELTLLACGGGLASCQMVIIRGATLSVDPQGQVILNFPSAGGLSQRIYGAEMVFSQAANGWIFPAAARNLVVYSNGLRLSRNVDYTLQGNVLQPINDAILQTHQVRYDYDQ